MSALHVDADRAGAASHTRISGSHRSCRTENVAHSARHLAAFLAGDVEATA